jgi:hypothetical protein
MAHKEIKLRIPWPTIRSGGFNFRRLLPTPGNVLFTLVMIALLVAAQTAGALPLGRPQGSAPTAASTGTIAYQGRLADAAGAPLTGTYNMIFRLYDVATGGTPLWSEQWTGTNGVRVSDGLFNVMLGSLTAIPSSLVTSHSSLFLGITVGTDDEMAPRVQLGSVPFAVQALTVPDGSVTTGKIADGAVTQAKLGADVSLVPPDGSITTTMIADGAVTSAKLGNNLALNGQLTASGNVGIGTMGPTARLDVRGLNAKSTETLDNIVFFGSNDSASPLGLIVQLRNSATTGIRRAILEVQDGVGTYRNLSLAEDGGKIGIGTTNPAAKLDVNGDFHASGTKSAVVQTDGFGQRKLYAVEAPDVRFSDEGLTNLRGGVVRIHLDPIFLETIEGEYLVHVTPYGDASLYVAEVGREYFVVKARAGDPDVAFAWRLSATRKGYAGVRLAEVK